MFSIPFFFLIIFVLPSSSIAAAIGRNETFSWSYPIEPGDSLSQTENRIGLGLGTDFGKKSLTSPSADSTSLVPVGPFQKTKTILLNEGEAYHTVSFLLTLSDEEKLQNVYHLVDNVDVVTKQTKETHQTSSSPIAYNISLNHEFEGTVGIARFLLQVSVIDKNGKSRKFMQTGSYVVAGIVAKNPSNNDHIASGILSQGLAFTDPEAVSLGAAVGQIPLKLEYQGLGPDVTDNPLPLEKVIATAQVSVKEIGSDDKVPLLSFDSSVCSSIQSVEKDKNGIFVFEETNCGIGFDVSAGVLVLNLNQGTDGSVEVDIALPTLMADGEVFETSILISVGGTTSPKPVVIVTKPITLLLDYYGYEEFTLLLYNTIQPVREKNATEYYVDLPNKRYAQIDFSRSTLVNPTQIVVFKTLRLGEEDSTVWMRIKRAIEMNYSHGKSEMEPSPTAEALENDIIDVSRSLDVDENTSSSGLYHMDSLHNSFVSGISEPALALTIKDLTPQETYTSSVHVGFPNIDDLVTAVNNYNNPIRTAFASSALAKKDGLENNGLKENIEFKLVLKDYSTSNFSEFKNQQIKRSIRAHALRQEEGTKGQAGLFRIKDGKDGLILRYELQVSGNSTKISKKLSKDKALPGKLAKDARLADDQVSRISVRAMTSRELQSIAGPETTLAGTVNLALIVSIVALVLILSIPLFILLLGFIATRRYNRDNDARNTENLPDVTPIPEEEGSDPREIQEATPASHIARDTFGRAQEDEEQESYKMQREMFKEGYYGDNYEPRDEQKQ